MAFPTSPTDGQQANVNGITYTYSSARSAWTVTSSFLDTFTGNALIANSATVTGEVSAGSIVAGNIMPAANNTYSLGNATTVWTDLYLANSTIYLGEATIGASGANLVLPATVQIGNATLTESGGSLAMPENMTATTMSVSGNITGGNVTTEVLIAEHMAINGFGNITAGDFIAYQNESGGFIRVQDSLATDVILLDGSQGLISAAGNITGGNVSTVGSMSAGAGTFSGNVSAVSIHPAESNTHDLGTTDLRWRNIYTNDLNLNNGIGDWTIVEGADDLFLYNNLRNKVYKFALIEVDPGEATPKMLKD